MIPNIKPNLLHFVWFGQDLTTVLAPLDSNSTNKEKGHNVTRLINWARQNPHYQVVLWTDHNSYEPVTQKINDNLEVSNIRIINFDENEFHCPNIDRLKDLMTFFRAPTKKNLTTLRLKVPSINEGLKNITVSFKKLSENYAAASDLARAIILYEVGGIYLDLDTKQKADKQLPNVGDLLTEENPIVLSYSNIRNVPVLGQLSNDKICCAENSPIIRDYLNTYRTQIERFPDWLMEITKCYKDRLDPTVILGPRLLRYYTIKHLFHEEMAEFKSMRQELDPNEKFYLSKYLIDYYNNNNFDALNKKKIDKLTQPLFDCCETGNDASWVPSEYENEKQGCNMMDMFKFKNK